MAQLFITDEFQAKNNVLIVTEKRIIDQLRKVLRAKTWYIFYLQNKTWNKITRYKAKVSFIKDKVEANILETETKEIWKNNWKWVITGILNKFDKMELIVQKLTEIWVSKIYFVPLERSQFKEIKENKKQRFYKIALEAAEQSWSWDYPDIQVFKNISEIKGTKAVLNFDWDFYKNVDFQNIDFLVIWPEWGFTDKDLEQIQAEKKISLWSKILRAETAAIIWGFILI